MAAFGIRPLLTDRRRLLGLGAALAGVAVAGCRNDAVKPDEQGRVRLRLGIDGPARPEHGGFYQAIASGAYARRNLNVEMVHGATGTDMLQALSGGAVEMALSPDAFTVARMVQDDAPVHAVAAFFQRDALVLITHAGRRAIESAADLSGRPFALTPPQRLGAWAWLKARYGFTDAQARPWTALPRGYMDDEDLVHLGVSVTDPFLIQRTDAPRPAVVPLEPERTPDPVPEPEPEAGAAAPRARTEAANAATPPARVEPGPGYGALLLAPDGFARDNAQALRDFIAASAEGWRDFVRGSPAETAAATLALMRKANPDLTPDVLRHGQSELGAQGLVDGGEAALYGIGAMTEARWRAFFDELARVEAFPSLDPRRAFTNQYLPGRG